MLAGASSFEIITWLARRRAGIAPAIAPVMFGKVRIGDRCWIGAKMIILKDVEFGDGCVVGAGTVVTGRFPRRQHTCRRACERVMDLAGRNCGTIGAELGSPQLQNPEER